MLDHTPPTTRGGEAGRGGWGTWGWGAGWGIGAWGIRRILCTCTYIYIYIYTHLWVPGLWQTKIEKIQKPRPNSTFFNNFNGKLIGKSSRGCLNRSCTALSNFYSSDYGNPVINRTVPCFSNFSDQRHAHGCVHPGTARPCV